MASYLVRAHRRKVRLGDLRRRLEDGEIEALYSFGEALATQLADARVDPETGDVLWEMEDYQQPPLARKRTAILDRYFTDIRVERVQPAVGWHRIEDLPQLWPDLRY